MIDKIWKKFEEHKEKGTAFGLKDHLWKLYLYEEGLLKIPEEPDENIIYDGCHCRQSHITILPRVDCVAAKILLGDTGFFPDVTFPLPILLFRDLFDKLRMFSTC